MSAQEATSGVPENRCEKASILGKRRRHLGPNLALFFEDDPLHIVRGQGCEIFDAEGNDYLDCVNNVSHVGHAHPRVVSAVSQQLATLNTNSRYLAEGLVVYMTVSGSEANDLAWRIASAAAQHLPPPAPAADAAQEACGKRAAPTALHVAVIDHAYHGHTSCCIDLSPYKFKGPGGGGRPTWVHVLPCPDVYRGRNLDGGAAARAAIAEAERGGARIAAFFSESILSCGGQVLLPDGYLAAVYREMRGHGAVCVADEVQCGFGRVGSAFWAFELQQVVPDIVTFGKPCGNGFPMAGLVTSGRLAAAFSNGMEFFATFGGCTAAPACGLAVLDVIREEQLQANAAHVGAHCMQLLSELQADHSDVVGDVRGEGLMIGVEIVTDAASRTPAPALARQIKQHCKLHHRVLLSSEGPYSSVIKIKPPICFTVAHAERMVGAIRAALESFTTLSPADKAALADASGEERHRTEPLLKLLFAKCDTDHAALDDRLRSAGRFCAAAVGTGGTQAVVASGQDGKAYLVSIALEGAALCVERLQPQGASAACCTFGLRPLLLPVGKLHSAFVHRLEAFVVVSGPSSTCQMLRLSLEPAQPVSQRRERVQLVPSAALPPPGPMLSAVDGGTGAAYLLACGGHRLFRFRCADQSLEELTQHGWPCDRQAVALWVHASKLLALTRKHPSSHGTAAAEQLEVWELPLAEAAVAGGGNWDPGDQWLVVQQPQWQQPAPGASESLAAAVVLVYSMCGNGWSAPASLQTASVCGHTSPHTLQPLVHLDEIREEVGKPSYFKQTVDSTGSRAISRAAVAGLDALQRHMAASPHGDGLGRLQQLWQQEMAVVADTQGGALAVWREWAPLKPIRLGEIAAPESLAYSLRQAQALRAALASPGITGSHTGADFAAVEASSGDDAHSDVMLQVTSQPPLPAIICPRIVAQQCGELLRQLEVLEEAGTAAGSWRGDGGQPIQLQQLVLTGVSRDEHAALQQLVNCLAGKTHAGLLEATQLLDVTRLADLLDAPALLEECVAVVACIIPGAEMVAPMLALAEARQYHPALHRLALFYRHALVLMMLSGQRSLLEWALHGLAAGVDTILEVCAEVADTWLPLEPETYLGRPGSDLTALASLKCHQQPPESLRMLLAALAVLLDRRQRAGFEQAGVQRRNGVAKKARVGSGAFTSAASRPACDPALVHGLQYHALVPYLQRLLQQLQRALPREAAWHRCEFTAAAFQAAEARAQRHHESPRPDSSTRSAAAAESGRMASRLLNDPEADGWERSDFPIACSTCLGPNPFVRMQRIEYGGQCHISNRPYTVFRWRPGSDARYKKTIICQEVAKAKNVCQVCLLDLEYGLPVQVRDQALGMANEGLPESDAGKEYALQRMQVEGDLDRSQFETTKPNELLMKLRRTEPYYQRNRARICSFFVRGECKRGAECPYRHEMPTSGPLSEQNIKDRYYGVNDPVANKMMDRVSGMAKLTPPEDTTICTLFVGGVTDDISEDDLRDQFYPFGELRSVKKVATRKCAFVTYATREAAERAAEEKSGTLIVKGNRLKLLWGKPQQPRPAADGGAAAAAGAAGGQPSGAAYPPAYMPSGGRGGAGHYPSMDPSAMGSHQQQQQQQSGPQRPRPPPGGPPPVPAGRHHAPKKRQSQSQAVVAALILLLLRLTSAQQLGLSDLGEPADGAVVAATADGEPALITPDSLGPGPAVSAQQLWQGLCQTGKPQNSVVELTITEAHSLMLAGQLTCTELVTAYQQRIAAFDQPLQLNSIRTLNPTALERAAQMDSQLQLLRATNSTGMMPPLLCVPLLLKDNIDVAGLSTLAGSLGLTDNFPLANAHLVDRLQQQGALVLAKTAMGEFAFFPSFCISRQAGPTICWYLPKGTVMLAWHASSHSASGAVRNPYSLSHTPAGSSGGSAAATAASFGMAGIGTDTGNSVRGPASHAALVGLRPSLGLDAVRVLDGMAGPDPSDPLAPLLVNVSLPLNYTQFLQGPAGLAGARIGVLRQISGLPGADSGIQRLFEDALGALQQAGASLADDFRIVGNSLGRDWDANRGGLGPAIGHWNVGGRWEELWTCNAPFREGLDAYLAAGNTSYRSLQEIYQAGAYHLLAQDGIVAALKAPYSSAQYPTAAMRDLGMRLIESMDAAQVDAVVYPTWNAQPLRVGGDPANEDGNNSPMIAPHTGSPAITVPMGNAGLGLPAGLQFLGRPFDEAAVIRLAHGYEQVTRHRLPPPLFPECRGAAASAPAG
ncbi:Zinc finger CCCH domain-containing protein 40 [Chlorella vulgaris]